MGSLAKTRVLVVDDNPDILAFMRTWLELNGYQVALAHDGVEALDVADEWRPDVILMDAFDRDGLSGSVSNEAFYGQVCAALAGRGVMIFDIVGEKDVASGVALSPPLRTHTRSGGSISWCVQHHHA